MDRNTNFNNIKKKNKKGFTLIELIVVVLILGIVAAVAVPKITVMMDETKEATFYTDFNNLRIAAMTAIAEGKIKEQWRSGGGSDNNNLIAQELAKILGKEVGIPYNQMYNIKGMEVPLLEKSHWHIVTDANGIYMNLGRIREDYANELGKRLGYGTPLLNIDSNGDKKIFWTGNKSAGHVNGQPTGQLRVLICEY